MLGGLLRFQDLLLQLSQQVALPQRVVAGVIDQKFRLFYAFHFAE